MNRTAREERFRTEEWRPGDPSSVIVTATFGGILLGILGEILFVGTGQSSNQAGRGGWLLLTLMLLLWLAGVPLIQYLLMRWPARVRPRFVLLARVASSKIFVGWSARGLRFGREVFAFICAIPVLAAWVVLPLCAASFPSGWGPGMVGALGIPMGMSLYWIRYSVVALRRPRGTLVEELEEGKLRFYGPIPHATGRTATDQQQDTY